MTYLVREAVGPEFFQRKLELPAAGFGGDLDRDERVGRDWDGVVGGHDCCCLAGLRGRQSLARSYGELRGCYW